MIDASSIEPRPERWRLGRSGREKNVESNERSMCRFEAEECCGRVRGQCWEEGRTPSAPFCRNEMARNLHYWCTRWQTEIEQI